MAYSKEGRLERLCSFIEQKEIDGVIVTHPSNIRYFTRFSGEEGIFLAFPPEWMLLVDPRYTLRAEEESEGVVVREAARPWEDIGRLLDRKGKIRVGIETAFLSVDRFRRLRRAMPKAGIKSLRDALDSLRMVKEEKEIAKIQEAVEIHTRALDRTLAWVSPDMTERRWAIEFEYQAKQLGAEALSFDTIVASGARSAIPHATSAPVSLELGAPLVFDHGVKWEGYCSDETATFFTGRPSKDFRNIYAVVKDAHDAAIERIQPGVRAAEIDAVARKVIEKAGYGPYFTHSTGHGVGLEIHERPTIGPRDDTRLEVGMVFTVEPGIYLRDKGGVRIEDMVVVTEDGCRMLTKRDKSLTVIFY